MICESLIGWRQLWVVSCGDTEGVLRAAASVLSVESSFVGCTSAKAFVGRLFCNGDMYQLRCAWSQSSECLSVL